MLAAASLPAALPMAAMPGADLAGPAPAEPLPIAGVAGGVAPAPAFVELLALLWAVQEKGEAVAKEGRTAAEPTGEQANEDEAGGDKATETMAAAFTAAALPSWWQAPVEAGGAPRPGVEPCGLTCVTASTEPGVAAVPIADAGAAAVPRVTASVSRPSRPVESPEVTSAAPAAPPESIQAPVGADSGRELAAPVSLGLRLEPRSMHESPCSGNPAASDPTPPAPAGRPATPVIHAARGGEQSSGLTTAEAKAATEASGSAARAKAPEATPAGESALHRAQDAARGVEAGESANAARAESKAPGEAMSSGTPGGTVAAAAATTAAHVGSAQLGRSPGGPSEQPPAARSTEVTPPPESPRELWLRVEPGRRGERAGAGVAVQVTERAGRIEVRVRTPDPGLGESLRREMPVLVERLEREGFRATALEAQAHSHAPASGILRLAQAEAAPAFEDEGRRGAEGHAGRHGERREQGQDSHKEGPDDSGPFVSEVTRWLRK